jgi:GNAT superfamily N-acetyltransferase
MEEQPKTDVQVRWAEPQDVNSIVEFNAALALESEGKSLDLDRLRDGVDGIFGHPERGFYLVAELAGGMVGQLLVTTEWSDWRNGDFWWIQSVYVAADYRRQGVYRALHNHVLSAARSRTDVCGVRLYVDQDNHVARQVYASLDMQQSHYDMLEIDFVL